MDHTPGPRPGASAPGRAANHAPRRSPARAGSPSSPAGSWSSAAHPSPTSRAATRAMTDRRAGRSRLARRARRRPRGHRARPHGDARSCGRRRPLPRDGGVLRHTLAAGPHDDAQHRVGPGEPRPRRRRSSSTPGGTARTTSAPCSRRRSPTRPSTWTGAPTGWRSTRLAVWQPIDPRRTRSAAALRRRRRVGVDRVRARRSGDDDPRPTTTTVSPSTRPMPFARWIHDGHELGWPTLDDLEYHLTTLFPPVRPRGWLELRMIDALPDEWWPVAVAVTTALLDDPEAADLASRETHRCCARGGSTPRATQVSDAAIGDVVARCFAARARGARRVSAPMPTRSRRRSATSSATSPAGAARPTTCSTTRARCRQPPDVPATSAPAPPVTSKAGSPSTRSTSARARTLAIARPGAGRRPAAPGVGADVAVVLGPRAHRPLRGAVAGPHARRRAAHRPAVRRRLRRVQAPAPRAAVACRSSTPTVPRAFVADVRDACARRARRASISLDDAATRCSPTGSSTAWSSSTSTSTTRRCSPPSSSWTTSRIPLARRSALGDRARDARRAAAPTCCVAGGHVRDGHRPSTRGRTTTSAPRTR